MCQRDRAGCPRLRRHSAGRGCRSVAGAATRQSRSLPQAGAATRQSRSSRRRPPAGGATASTRARSAPHCARLSTRRRYATRRPQPARGRLSLPRSAIRRRSAARGSSKNRRSPPHHWSRAPLVARLRRVQLASARVGDRRGGRYDRRNDVEETTDAPKTPSPCFTSAPPAGRERRVYCGKYRHGKYKREYAPTHTCDMPEKLPETKTARAGSPRRSSRAVERRCVARSSRPRHPSLPNLLPARRRELELRPRPLGVEHRVRPALRRPSAASRALLRSRLALPIRVLKLGLNHGDLLRDPLHPQLMLPLQLYPLLVQLIQPHKQSGLRAVRQRHRLQDAVVLRSKF